MVSTEIATILAALKPDRGNRYARATVRASGKGAHVQWVRTCDEFAFFFARHLPGFDRAAFLRACGVEE